MSRSSSSFKKRQPGTDDWYAAGVLPISVVDGQLKILVGRESKGNLPKSGKWDGFGGGREDQDKSPLDNAIREMDEETMGCLGNPKIIKGLLSDTHLYVEKGSYYMYVLPYPYTKAPVQIYNAILAKLDKCFVKKILAEKSAKHLTDGEKKPWVMTVASCPSGILEKTELKWFSLGDVLENKREFNPTFYRSVIAFMSKEAHNLTRSWRKMVDEKGHLDPRQFW
jgi:hypothetical protein